MTPETRAVFGSGLQQFSPADLEVVGRRFAQLTFPFSSGWSELLGSEVMVTVAEVTPGLTPTLDTLDPATSSTLLDLAAGPGSFRCIGTFGPDLDAMALVIPVQLGLVVVDRLLGGIGRPIGDRELSDIDLDLLSTLLEPTFSAMSDLRPAGQGHLPVGRINNGTETQLNERLAEGSVVTMTVAMADLRLPLHIVLGPSATRELAGVRSQATHTTPLSKSESELKMQSALQSVFIDVVVAFESVDVASHRVLTLEVGDVIPLRTSPEAALPMFVDGKRLALVRPARAGNQVACQIVSTFQDDQPSEHDTPESPASGGSL